MATADTARSSSANQPPPLAGYNLVGENRPLVEGLRREGAGWAEERALDFGATLGGEPLEWGRLANEHPPELHTHDRFGERIDEVEFHPAWHSLLRLAVEHELHALPWRAPQPGAHVARGASFMALTQVEAGVGCPLSMTYAAVPVLSTHGHDEWAARLCSTSYDDGALAGMAMTERQGGSDVRANTTRAEETADGWSLTGDKWFCSAPMCDVFLALAQAPGGLSCFLVPRLLPDGTHNALHLDRLKDKLGNRSNASAELRLERARAELVGDEGAGIRTIIEMVALTRLDCVLGSAALQRQAVAEATHHAAYRKVFGKLLVDHLLMLNVLADLCVESEAATVTALRLCAPSTRATTRSGGSRLPWRSSGSASARRRSSPRRSSASAATAMSRSPASRGSSAKAHSTRSGKEPAT